MNSNNVTFVAMKHKYDMVKIDNNYAFNHEGKMLWLQRILFRVLSKLGCDAYSSEVEVKRYKLNSQDILDEILQQETNLIDYYESYGDYVLVGSENLAEFKADPSISKYILLQPSYRNSIGEISGMTIVIVPWMTGILVVPKLQPLIRYGRHGN